MSVTRQSKEAESEIDRVGLIEKPIPRPGPNAAINPLIVFA
jgi:hypothetical protein